MGKLAIVRPFPLNALGGTMPNVARLLTPDPKEAAIDAAGGARTIDIDLGLVRTFDTIFLGFLGSFNFTLSYGSAGYAEVNLANTLRSDLIAPELADPIRHAVAVLAAPVNGRYIRISGAFPAGFTIGVLAVGLSFQAFWGHEWGAGRPVEDTGTAERLIGGGFGINEGVRVGGYQWTFGDLTDAETRQLYTIARDRGTTRSVLVVEDVDQSVGLHERVHWGLLDRLEAYERTHPGNTRWNLRVRDWA